MTRPRLTRTQYRMLSHLSQPRGRSWPGSVGLRRSCQSLVGLGYLAQSEGHFAITDAGRARLADIRSQACICIQDADAGISPTPCQICEGRGFVFNALDFRPGHIPGTRT